MTTEFEYHTKEAAIAAVTQSALELRYCSPELQNDEEVVMTALKQDSLSFYHASAELKSSKAFIMKALNEGVEPTLLIEYANIDIQSDLDVMFLTVEKSNDGKEFGYYAKEKVALNKELAAKALVKWGNRRWGSDLALWEKLHPTLKDFFQKDCWYEKAKSYLYQLEQEKQAKKVSGGSTAEDGVVW